MTREWTILFTSVLANDEVSTGNLLGIYTLEDLLIYINIVKLVVNGTFNAYLLLKLFLR